jgi:hypothetical protein
LLGMVVEHYNNDLDKDEYYHSNEGYIIFRSIR